MRITRGENDDPVPAGQAGKIGGYLRLHGSGQHWFERFRGQGYPVNSHYRGQEILLGEFSDLLDVVTPEADGTWTP